MKSFGVRLAAGAVTVLLGAFAAAQAQKDRQKNSQDESWSAATPPSLEQTPTPIAEAEESWLSQSTTNDPLGPPSAVQLVQHTEVVDTADDGQQLSADGPAITLPPFDPDAAADPDVNSEGSEAEINVVAAPDWTLPPAGSSPNADAGTAESMSLPGSAAAPADMQELKFADAPSMVIPDAVDGAPYAASPDTPAVSAASLPQDADAAYPDAVDGFPNALRNDGSDNQLRGGAGDFAAGAIAGAAIGATGVAIGAAASDSIGPDYTNTPNASAGLGQPTAAGQPEEFAQPDAFAQPPAFDQPAAADQPTAFAQPTGFAQPPAFGQPVTGQEVAPPSQNLDPSAAGTFAQPGTFAASQNDAPGYGPSGSDPLGNGQPYPAAGPEARVASLPGSNAPLGAGYGTTAYGQPTPMDQPPGATPMNANATTTSPGDRRLEGVQSPSIVIHKRAPGEVKVGKPASFVIQVQNVGSVEALDVRVQDAIPSGMRLVDASPTPLMQGDRLLWELGAMAAGDERTVTMQLVAEQEGELGSVARVTFEAAASVRTISTRPELKIVQRVPTEKILIGQQLEIDLEVSNPGTGVATGVILQEDVPEGLEHPKGRQLDNLLGDLAPSEVRRQVLRLRAVKPGVIENRIRLVGDDGLTAEHVVSVEVVAPELSVELSGPSKRFLERQATYNLEIANVGTAPATNVEIVVQLDRGFNFVSTEYEGQYDSSRHAVIWSLEQLPEGSKGKVPLTLLPVEEGEQAIKVEARADLGVVANNDRTIAVDGFAELTFQVTNQGGPIEIGAETVYEVKVRNSGSKNDTNVQIQLQLPPGLELVSADGEAGTDGRGLVAFQPQAELAAGSELAYKLRVRGVTQGTHIVKAMITSDQSTVPVTKEESTRVYADR